MKLSEAIREGAKLRPQAFRAYYQYREDVLCTCALGAAFEALHGKVPTTRRISVEEIEAKVGRIPNDVFNQIINWNDGEKLSREEIADRLEAMGL